MTLLDAPKFDDARAKRLGLIGSLSLCVLLLALIASWFIAGRPVDWPWNWPMYLTGRATVDKFLTAVEKNDLPAAYGIWMHDPNWQKHASNAGPYPFDRFQDDWSSTSPDNEYGAYQSHKIALAGRYGNGLLVAVLINGRKSNALNLQYDPKTKTLAFAPPGVALYLGP